MVGKRDTSIEFSPTTVTMALEFEDTLSELVTLGTVPGAVFLAADRNGTICTHPLHMHPTKSLDIPTGPDDTTDKPILVPKTKTITPRYAPPCPLFCSLITQLPSGSFSLTRQDPDTSR
jgi:hypothetical protein